jgi:hypothetical protein
MVSAIRKQQKAGAGSRPEGGALNKPFQYDYYSQIETNKYLLFVLATRSPQTKQKYLQRVGYFLEFARVANEKTTPSGYVVYTS